MLSWTCSPIDFGRAVRDAAETVLKEHGLALGNAVVGGEAWSAREGASVEVRSATPRADELATVVANAKGALVLVRTNRERIEVKAVLARAGVKAQDVMTIHASRGKEADRVVLACGRGSSRFAALFAAH